MSEKKRLYTLESAMEYLSASKTLLKTLEKEGSLKPIKVGPKSIRYDKVDLDNYILNQKNEVADLNEKNSI